LIYRSKVNLFADNWKGKELGCLQGLKMIEKTLIGIWYADKW